MVHGRKHHGHSEVVLDERWGAKGCKEGGEVGCGVGRMSTVDEWAKREAEVTFGVSSGPMVMALRGGFSDGVSHLAALLLSDEAVRAGVAALDRNNFSINETGFRLAVEAALTKIKEDKE
jgi:hypothetical protein